MYSAVLNALAYAARMMIFFVPTVFFSFLFGFVMSDPRTDFQFLMSYAFKGSKKRRLLKHYDTFWRKWKASRLIFRVGHLEQSVKRSIDLIDKELLVRNGWLSDHQAEIYSHVTALLYPLTLLCSVMMLYLLIRVQDIILWRKDYRIKNDPEYKKHLKPYNDEDQIDFLAMDDHLPVIGIKSFFTNMQIASCEVLKDKNFREPLNENQMFEIIRQILVFFLHISGPTYCVNYVLPEDSSQEIYMFDGDVDDIPTLSNITLFGQAIFETRTVLASPSFVAVLELSLEKIAKFLAKEIFDKSASMNFTKVSIDRLIHLKLEFPFLVELDENKMIDVLFVDETEYFFKNLFSGSTTMFLNVFWLELKIIVGLVGLAFAMGIVTYATS